MKRANQGIRSNRDFSAMAETRFAVQGQVQGLQHSQDSIPGERTQADNNPQSFQHADLFNQVREAIVSLPRSGMVIWRGTANAGRDVAVLETESIVPGDGSGLIGEPCPVQSGEQPI